jgi:hypothetical protein
MEYKKKYYFILNTWDGLFERTPLKTKFELKTIDEYNYADKTEISHADAVDTIHYPILHKNITIFIAGSKRIHDPYTILLPDFHYIKYQGYIENKIKVDMHNIPFQEKIPTLLYRGELYNGDPYNFGEKYNSHIKIKPRVLFANMCSNKYFQNVNFSTHQMSIDEMIKYKYILDIDGYVNSWDGLFWKLYSGSVVLKTASIWKEWYYDELQEYIHYVPVASDYSDLNEKIQWCLENEFKCYQISLNARKFVEERLNWNAVKQYTIDIAKVTLL